MILNKFYRYIVLLFLIFLTGCAGLETETGYPVNELPEPELNGIYHKVKEGESLWRIAKAYNVAINDIINANNIPNAAKIEKGQLVFIPGAYKHIEIIVDRDSNKGNFIWPVKGTIISYFRENKEGNINKGIDIKAKDGTPVVASKTGRVVLSDFISGYGYTVILSHSDGFYTIYSHNGKVLVKVGALVLKNQDIAYVGRSNRQSYLHFEIRKNAVENNPLYYLP